MPKEKVLITGDDILIDYVQRLIHALRILAPDQMLDPWRLNLEKFITHQVWQAKDKRSSQEQQNWTSQVLFNRSQGLVQYWSGLEVRLTEMNERRRKLIKYIFKKEGRLHQFEESFKSCLE